MSKRFTDTEKWDDKWFRGLPALEKLCFIFICDRCDLAGFYEIDLEDMEFKIKAPKDDIKGALKGLARGFRSLDSEIGDGSIIWIRKFIFHQKNFPLNENNPAHKSIISIINTRPQFYKILEKEGALKGHLSPIGIGNGIGIGSTPPKEKEFYPPTLIEIEGYTKEKDLKIDHEYYFNSRTATGWRKANNQFVKNWKSDLLNADKSGQWPIKRKERGLVS